MSKSICSVAGCNCMVVARGYCNKHYLRWKHHGDPLGGVNGASVRKVIDYPDCTRICTGCGKRLPIAMFDRDKFASKGRKSKCKKCRSSQMHVLYESENTRSARINVDIVLHILMKSDFRTGIVMSVIRRNGLILRRKLSIFDVRGCPRVFLIRA